MQHRNLLFDRMAPADVIEMCLVSNHITGNVSMTLIEAPCSLPWGRLELLRIKYLYFDDFISRLLKLSSTKAHDFDHLVHSL